MTRTAPLTLFLAAIASVGCLEVQDFGSATREVSDAGPASPQGFADAGEGGADAGALAPRWDWVNPTPTGVNMTGIWVLSDTDAWLVGPRGTVVHWDGTTLHDESTGWTGDNYFGVWASSDSDVWVIGNRAVHWDGTAWSADNELNTVGGTLYSVWGSGSADVWIAGTPDDLLGTSGLFHFNGVQWQAATGLGDPAPLVFDVWGSGPADVWAVGGQFAHYDGTTWTVGISGPPPISGVPMGPYTAVWGSAANDVWAEFAGQNSASSYTFGFSHFDGTQWTTPLIQPVNGFALPANAYMPAGRRVWGTFAGGGAALAPDGTVWSQSAGTWGPTAPAVGAQQTALGTGWPAALGGVPGGALWGAGDYGQLLRFGSNQLWTGVLNQPRDPLSAASVAHDGTLFATSGPTVYRWGSSGWESALAVTPSMIGRPGAVGPPQVGAISAIAADDAWLAGTCQLTFTGGGDDDFVEFVAHWNGSSMDILYSEVLAGETWGAGAGWLWAGSANDVWVGLDYGLAHWDGTSWNRNVPGTHGIFNDENIWGSGPNDVWFAGLDGDEGVVLRWDGTQLAEVYRPQSGGVPRVWGTGPNDVWAGAAHWNGVSWTVLPGNPSVGVGWSAGPNDVWMIGDATDTLQHWDGTTLSAVFSTDGVRLNAVAGASSTDVWAVGEGGATLHYHVPGNQGTQ